MEALTYPQEHSFSSEVVFNSNSEVGDKHKTVRMIAFKLKQIEVCLAHINNIVASD